MTARDEAIAYIEECRLTHVQWAEWQEKNPDWRDEVRPEDPGLPEHHREWIAKYDQVLAVLRGEA